MSRPQAGAVGPEEGAIAPREADDERSSTTYAGRGLAVSPKTIPGMRRGGDPQSRQKAGAFKRYLAGAPPREDPPAPVEQRHQ